MCVASTGGANNYIGTDQIGPTGPLTEEGINRDRQALDEAHQRLYEQQRSFNQTQERYISTIEEMTKAAAEREAAQYNQALADRHAASLPSLIQTNTGDESENFIGASDSILDSQRRGRRSLRIDLQAPASGISGSGLNVPRG